MLRKYLGESGIDRKGFFIILILLFNAFTWWYFLPIIIEDLLETLNVTDTQTIIVWTSYFAAIVGSSMFGSIFSNRIDRLNFIYLWIISGTVTSALPALFYSFTLTHVLILSILLGASFGLGMPSCLAYFADCTLVENRGRIGGIILLFTNLGAPLLGIPFEVFGEVFGLTVNLLIFAMWRGAGLIIYFLKPKKNPAPKTRKISFASILGHKPFLFYFVAWFMFCLVDRLEGPILTKLFSEEAPFPYHIVGPMIGSLSALMGGLLSDWIGRKRVVLYGFATLGIAYAIISIVPSTEFSSYFYLTIGSISTGFLWVAFLLILWADLSQSGTREKYYVIGTLPFFLANIIQPFSAPHAEEFPTGAAFSLAAFFLFIAVLPLLYAPETLPERKIELRRLRKYVETARKVKEKYTENNIKS